MFTFSDPHCCDYGKNYLCQIEDKCSDYICDIIIGDALITEDYTHGPPESITIDEQNEELCEQCLGTVPPYKSCGLSVPSVKNKGGKQIHYRQRDTDHKSQQ